MTKSTPGQPTQNIEDFVEKAKDVAKDGQELSRSVSNWCPK